jgi:hypothetical protein
MKLTWSALGAISLAGPAERIKVAPGEELAESNNIDHYARDVPKERTCCRLSE